MTKKDYKLIADVFYGYCDQLAYDRENLTPEEADATATAHRDLAYRMATALQGTNPRFDRYRFLDACGVKQ